MWFFNKSSTVARTALFYITVGAFTVIWTGIWFVYLFNNPPESNDTYYWSTGFLVTGLVLLLIGLGVGRFGRATPLVAPQQPVAPVAQTTAPAATPVVALVDLTKPVVTTDGKVIAPPPKVANRSS
jgi:hypothetical protein